MSDPRCMKVLKNFNYLSNLDQKSYINKYFSHEKATNLHSLVKFYVWRRLIQWLFDWKTGNRREPTRVGKRT